MNPAIPIALVCLRVETVSNPNSNLMVQYSLLLTPNRAFPVQLTTNAEVGLPSVNHY